jgi:hypothetical protein
MFAEPLLGNRRYDRIGTAFCFRGIDRVGAGVQPVRRPDVRAPFLLMISALLSGCAQSGFAPDPAETFAQEVAGRTAGKPRNCIAPFGNQNLRIVNPQTLAYGTGPTIHINRMRTPCPSLDPSDSIIVETLGGQYCRGDRVRSLEPGATIPGPVCILGDWTPYVRP